MTLLDARLTPIDAFANPIASAFGGDAHDSAGAAHLVLPPGALSATTDIRVTPISGQGLAGRLPYGWSPIAAVDLAPHAIVLAQPGALTMPNVAQLAAGASVVVATYDPARHGWIAAGTAQVSADGRSIAVALNVTGQIACLAADDPPFAPPVPAAGDVLAGIAGISLPGDATGSGDVVPRSAPPGDHARAIGRVLVGHANALPSGTTVRAAVSERFALSDQSQVIPQAFTEDLVLYTRGRPSGDGAVGATFPITPSRNYTIQELLRGVVSVDVAAPVDAAGGTIVGAAGGVASDASGDTAEVSGGALAGDTVVTVQRVGAGPDDRAAAGGLRSDRRDRRGLHRPSVRAARAPVDARAAASRNTIARSSS